MYSDHVTLIAVSEVFGVRIVIVTSVEGDAYVTEIEPTVLKRTKVRLSSCLCACVRCVRVWSFASLKVCLCAYICAQQQVCLISHCHEFGYGSIKATSKQVIIIVLLSHSGRCYSRFVCVLMVVMCCVCLCVCALEIVSRRHS